MKSILQENRLVWHVFFLLACCLLVMFLEFRLAPPVLGAVPTLYPVTAEEGPHPVGVLPQGCTIAPGANSSYQQVFQTAYARQGGEANMGCAKNQAHWWEGLVVQDFEGGAYGYASIFHDENKQAATAFVLRWKILDRYWHNSDWGPPLSDVRSAWQSPRGTNGYLADFWDMAVYDNGSGVWVIRGVTKTKYDLLDGSRGVLGFPTDDGRPARDSASITGGWYQTFEGPDDYGGALHTYAKDSVWHAYATYGAILGKYNEMGGSGSAVGYPVNNVETATRSLYGTTGKMARFEDGDIYTSTKGTFVVRGVSKDTYNRLGGSGGVLGFPTMDGAPARNSSWTTGGWYQWFEGGMLHTYAKNGQWRAYETHGPILDKYNNMGGSASAIGYPINDVEMAAPSPKGVKGHLARFEDGDIYTSAKGTFVIRGVTRTKYDSLDGSRGILGFPENDGQTAATSPTGISGYYQPFEGGIMHTFEKAGVWRAYPVHGAIQAKYNSIGGSGSQLGFPVGDEADSAISPAGTQGRYQEFEGGQIYYHKTGTFVGASFVVAGGYRSWYNREGGSSGWLGLPISDERNGRVLFENGYVDSSGTAHRDPQTLTAKVMLEANYILAAQYRNEGHPADGALNNVAYTTDDWTWIVPRENALAILGLLRATDVTGISEYREAAQRTADYLVGIQQSDGAWANQYNYAVVSDSGKSPTQTAEVMIALYKLGYKADRWNNMKKGAEYLLECQKVINKTGDDDGLLGGGRKSDGDWSHDRWTQDNAFAYQALRGAADWAKRVGDTDSKNLFSGAAVRILAGIRDSLYDSSLGIWHKAIDQTGNPLPGAKEWGNYSPQMLDLPTLTADKRATGVGDARVGSWIHDHLQHTSGGILQDTASSKLSPGFSFQAALVWRDLAGQGAYVDQAITWAENSGLWCKSCGTPGGWIDWITTDGATRAAEWERFIDTSFYVIAAWTGGYNFKTADGDPTIVYGPAPTPFLDLPIEYDHTPETFARLLTNSAGGVVTAWFDHRFPNRTEDKTLQLFSQTYLRSPYRTNGLQCFGDGWCYDGHNGLDFGVLGEALAAAKGSVVKVNRCGTSCPDGYGNYVVLYHTVDKGNSYFTRYAHLASIADGVNEGHPIERGAKVGQIGNSGTGGKHLHFSVYRDDGNGTWDCSQYGDPASDTPVDPFGWTMKDMADPWVAERSGASSYPLWIHEFTHFALASGQTTTLTDATGTIQLTIPAGTLPPSTDLALTTQPGPLPVATMRSSGQSFALDLQASASVAADSLSVASADSASALTGAIAIQVSYAAGSISHLDESQLTLRRWDDTQQGWLSLPTTIDPGAGRASASTTSLGQFDLQAPLRCQDQSEPNDRAIRAVRIWSNDTPIRQSLDGPQDVDWRQFYASAGEIYTIFTANLTPGVAAVLNLYDPSGEQLLLSSSGTAVGSQLQWQALASGLYLIQVQSQPGSATGCAAEYDLGITTDTGLVISIESTAYDLRLSWQHNAQYSGYRVFSSSTPYLSVDDPRQQSEYIPTSAADSEVSYVQSLASLPDRYFYLIAPSDASGEPVSVAGRVGKFTFGLVTGSSDPPSGGGNNVAGSDFCSGLSVGEMASPSFKIAAICGQAGILLDSDTAMSPNYRHRPGLAGVLP